MTKLAIFNDNFNDVDDFGNIKIVWHEYKPYPVIYETDTVYFIEGEDKNDTVRGIEKTLEKKKFVIVDEETLNEMVDDIEHEEIYNIVKERLKEDI